MKINDIIRHAERTPIYPVIEYRVDQSGKIIPDSLELCSGLHELENYTSVDNLEYFFGEGCGAESDISLEDYNSFLDAIQEEYNSGERIF